MASSNKTEALHLNSWVGSDVPKMEDFNADNAILDAVIGVLKGKVETLEVGGGTSGGGGADPRLDTHLADSAVHLSEEDRTALENAAPVCGSYTGNGNAFQGVTLGFRPSYGFVYADEKPIMSLNATGNAQFTHFCIVSKYGSTYGVEATPMGFNAFQLGTASEAGQTSAGMNTNGQRYVYVVWE